MPPLLQVDLLARLAASYPEATGWKNLADGQVLTLGVWHARSNQLARGLCALGLGAGDRVALAVAEDDPLAWLTAYMGIHKATGIAVPLNTRLQGPELQRILRHAEPAAVLASHSVLDVHPELASAAATVISTELGWGEPWSEVLAADAADLELPLAPDQVADIMYTSGTTGEPKGVVVRHGGLSTIDRVPPSWLGLGFVSSSPFSTTSGSLLVCGPMRGGLSGWFFPRFDPAQWLSMVGRERPVVAFLVPAMVQLLVAHPDLDQADLSSLAVVNVGSAPISATTLRRFGRLLPNAELLCGYGMTEFGAVTAMPMGDGGAHLGSVGVPLPGVEVAIVDAEGRVVPTGTVGEVTIKGDQAPRTYFHDTGGSASTWSGGWLHSGDLGRIDPDGFLWIEGRRKEIIIRGGHNIMPGEIEAALFSHPLVVDAAVAGIPHDVLGEDVAAWVVLADQPPDAIRVLHEFLLTQLADYKVPRRITVVAGLPRNAAGKVLKGQLVSASPRKDDG